MAIDIDLAIGRTINRLAPPDSPRHVKVTEIVEQVLPEVASDLELTMAGLRRELKERTRRFLKSRRDIYSVGGERMLVERFTHYSDGNRGDRWVRTPALTRSQLGMKITQMRRQQRGYDVRLRVYEAIFDLLPDDTALVGQVLRTTESIGESPALASHREVSA